MKQARIPALYPSLGLPSPCPWSSHGCAATHLCIWIFSSAIPCFTRRLRFSAPQVKRKQRDGRDGSLAQRWPPGVSCAALPMECRCELGLAPAVGQRGHRAPPASRSWLLLRSKPRTSSSEAAEAEQVHGSCSLQVKHSWGWENRR